MVDVLRTLDFDALDVDSGQALHAPAGKPSARIREILAAADLTAAGAVAASDVAENRGPEDCNPAIDVSDDGGPAATEGDADADGPREWALPGVHDAARRMIDKLPRGCLLDLAAGEGALSQWAHEAGFSVTATEMNRSVFRAAGIRCVQADLNQPLPLPDASADVVAALEIIEHLENQYQFVREIARVLRPGGHAILSTPNEHNVQNRWNYFLTGFYGDSRHVIREDDPEMPLRHINMIPPSQLELAWRRAGLELIEIDTSKQRLLAWLLIPFVLPVQRMRYRRKLRRIDDPREHETCRRVYSLLDDVRMLTGRVVVYHLLKPGGPAQASPCEGAASP